METKFTLIKKMDKEEVQDCWEKTPATTNIHILNKHLVSRLFVFIFILREYFMLELTVLQTVPKHKCHLAIVKEKEKIMWTSFHKNVSVIINSRTF